MSARPKTQLASQPASQPHLQITRFCRTHGTLFEKNTVQLIAFVSRPRESRFIYFTVQTLLCSFFL